MKYKLVNLLVGVVALTPLSMAAHAGIHIGIGIVPPPLYFGPPPAYYSPPPPVYYGPGIVYGEGDWNYGGDFVGRWHDRGWAHDRWHGARGWGGHDGRGHGGR